MTTILFNNETPGDPLYWSDVSDVLPLVNNYALGYRVVGTDIPSELTLAQSWNDYHDGVYLFLKNKPSDLDKFETQLSAYLSSPGMNAVRFLWIDNPSDARSTWQSAALSASFTNNNWIVKNLITFDFINYGLIIGRGCSIALNDTGFIFQAVNNIPASLRFTAGNGAYSYNETRGQISLSFSGLNTGAFNFKIALDFDVHDADKPLRKLDAGLRYFVDNVDFPDTDLLTSFRYPVLAPVNDFFLYGQIDVVNLTVASRSFLAFQENEGQGIAIPSYWRTALGHTLDLTPKRTPDTSGAALVFTLLPNGTGSVASAPCYLSYEGDFGVTTALLQSAVDDDVLEPKERLMPGASGIEYLGFMDVGDYNISFVSGQAAYAPNYILPIQDIEPVSSSSIVGLESKNGLLTTSWINLTGPANNSVYYFAQPHDSEFYQAPPQGSGQISMARVADDVIDDTDSPVLWLLEIPAKILAQPLARESFPSVPYSGLQEKNLESFRALEAQVLSPVRRSEINNFTSATSNKKRTLLDISDAEPVGVTPQGLLGKFSADLLNWHQLILAQTPRVIQTASSTLENIEQKLEWVNVVGPLKSAFQSNQLFLVLNDPVKVLDNASVTFRLTVSAFTEFSDSDGPDHQPIPDHVITAIESSGIIDQYYQDVSSYEAALQSALQPADYQQYRSLLLYFGAFADLNVDDWTFHVSPYHWLWSTDESKNTIAVFKFGDRSLLDMAADLSAWTWLDGAGGDTGAAKTQESLLSIINSGIEDSNLGRTELDNFKNVVSSPSWNGIIFLNVPFNLQELPSQLEGLAAGIAADDFFVHHVGINISPVHTESGTLALQNSTLFGLIDYQSYDDINYTGVDYDFKVQRLSVLFENSHIQTFNSLVQVQLNTLFGESSTLRYADNGNNIVLSGVYQRHDDSSSYIFVQNEPNIFDMKSFVLAEIDIQRVQFFTVTDDAPKDSDQDSTSVSTQFIFSGMIRFQALEGFDVFSYGSVDNILGGLSFDSLTLSMLFDSQIPEIRQFVFSANDININVSQSLARATSIVNHFPLVFNSFIQGSSSSTPGDLGYMDVSSPLNQGRMEEPWYGLSFDLDLGTLGALASSAGLNVTLMAAWSTAGLIQNVYVGLKLPGSVSSQTRIPIEGLLSLNFKQIELVVIEPKLIPDNVLPIGEFIESHTNDKHLSSRRISESIVNKVSGPSPEGTSYMLKFRGVSFNFLTLAFPPGDIEVYLFGNPDNDDANLLGWYAAYVNES
jgi:hypothetical protein